MGIIEFGSSKRRDFCSSSVLSASKFVRAMRGGSQSILLQANDLRYYVVKMAGNPQGTGVLANELLGWNLACECGLPMPDSGAIFLSDAFIDQNPSIWFETVTGVTRPQAGMHFRSLFLGHTAGPDRPTEYISPTSVGTISNRNAFLGMYIFDVWANHLDHRQALFTRVAGAKRETVFIDNGHLFGGPHWTTLSRPGIALHMERTIYAGLWQKLEVEAWISHFRSKIPAALSAAIHQVTKEWCPGDIGQLAEWLMERLNCLEDLVYADADRSGLIFVEGRVVDVSRLSNSGTRLSANVN